MAGFQDIFEIQQSMTVQNRRMVGQQVSRSGQLRVAEYLTSVPWVFTITPHSYLYYPQVRDVIQAIDNLDRQLPETIVFSSTNLSWFTAYQGSLTSGQLSALTWSAGSTNTQTLTVTSLPSVSSTTYIFKAGDFLQIGAYSYKVKYDVQRGLGVNVSVQIHRPLIGSTLSGSFTNTGNACTFYMVAEKCPTYTLNPMTNGAFVQWDGPFVFREDIT